MMLRLAICIWQDCQAWWQMYWKKSQFSFHEFTSFSDVQHVIKALQTLSSVFLSFKNSFSAKAESDTWRAKTLSSFFWITAPKDLRTPKKLTTSEKENACCKELQYPEVLSDTDDSVFVDSPWQEHRHGGVKDLKESWKCLKVPPPQSGEESAARGSVGFLAGRAERSCEGSTGHKTSATPPRQSAELQSDSSDGEFESLIERIRKRNTPRKPILSTSKAVYQPSTRGKKWFLADLQAVFLKQWFLSSVFVTWWLHSWLCGHEKCCDFSLWTREHQAALWRCPVLGWKGSQDTNIKICFTSRNAFQDNGFCQNSWERICRSLTVTEKVSSSPSFL